MPDPYAQGQLLYAAGCILDRRGEPAMARLRPDEALATMTRLGARKDAARAETALATLALPGAAPAHRRQQTSSDLMHDNGPGRTNRF
jgi:hypothetical protein